MVTFLTILYVFVCVFLILVVLLQAGRGGGMGAAFGGSSQTVFGGAGAGNFLTRLTVVMAAMFMILSASLAYLSSSSDKALENASHAIKMREDARALSPKDKNDAKDDNAKGAQSSSATSNAPAENSAAPVENAPGEGEDEEGAAPEGAAAPAAGEPAQQPAAPSAPAKP
jgi:preprotein translocase subunit SecG